jgi:hypothetical protein
MSCWQEPETQVFFGEVRINSNVGLPRLTPDTASLLFGDQVIGVPGDVRTVTLTSSGGAEVVTGAASIVGGNAFAITSDTCSNTAMSLTAGCFISVRATATALGGNSAKLRLPVNYGSGMLEFPLLVGGTDPKLLSIFPASLNFGPVAVGHTGAARSVSLAAIGISPVTIGDASLGGTTPAAFSITDNTCSGGTIPVGQSCSITVTPHPTSTALQTAQLLIQSDNMTSPASVSLSVTGQPDNSGTYYAVTPSRILDTREGNGAAKAPVGPGGTIALQVAGRGEVPASGVSAVVLNVTVTAPTTSGHITVWPSGVGMPTASSLNFVPGWTGANSVTVALGADGKVALYNSAGKTHLIADVVGYYAKDNVVVPAKGFGGEFQPVLPERLFDSRADWGFKLSAGDWLQLPVSYGEDYDPHIRALAVNVTAVDGAGNGYLTTFNGEGSPPFTSTLNFTNTGAVPNFAVVPTGHCNNCPWPASWPIIGVYASVDVHVIVDIVGFYDDGQLADGTNDGLRFMPQTPVRIVDSRIGQGIAGALGQGSTASVSAGSLPPATWALSLNVTAVSPTATTFISVWPNGLDQPTVSTLNPNRGQIVPNAAPVLLGVQDKFNVYNNAGSTHMVIDLVGTFYYRPDLGVLGPSLAFKHADGDVPTAPPAYVKGLHSTTAKAILR